MVCGSWLVCIHKHSWKENNICLKCNHEEKLADSTWDNEIYIDSTSIQKHGYEFHFNNSGTLMEECKFKGLKLERSSFGLFMPQKESSW